MPECESVGARRLAGTQAEPEARRQSREAAHPPPRLLPPQCRVCGAGGTGTIVHTYVHIYTYKDLLYIYVPVITFTYKKPSYL